VKFSRINKAIGIAVLSMVSLSSFAQDIIARQAPSDKRLKDIHNVKLNSKLGFSAADLNDPASNIYTDWTDNLRSCSGSVPSNYKIDLRGFCMPTPSRKINSPFGPRWGRQHEGLDIKVYIGDTIRAAFDGKVRICKYNGSGYGYYIVIRHPNGLETLYGHLSKQIVKKDQVVRAGDPIGLGGNTGKSSGSHLHFETRVLGQPINPALLFDFVNQDVTGDYFIVNNGFSKGNVAKHNSSK
jgi:murein DD-endopeptidase MepM/ murein hydrolase activator NlpD